MWKSFCWWSNFIKHQTVHMGKEGCEPSQNPSLSSFLLGRTLVDVGGMRRLSEAKTA